MTPDLLRRLNPRLVMTVVGVYDTSRGIPKLTGSGGGVNPTAIALRAE